MIKICFLLIISIFDIIKLDLTVSHLTKTNLLQILDSNMQHINLTID